MPRPPALNHSFSDSSYRQTQESEQASSVPTQNTSFSALNGNENGAYTSHPRRSAQKANKAIKDQAAWQANAGRDPTATAQPNDDELFSDADSQDEDLDVEDDDSEDDDPGEEVGGFLRQRSLPPYEFVRRNVGQLIGLIDSPHLNLSPEYQREVVWPKKKMIKLIDSLFENYYMPPVIFNLWTGADPDGIKRFKRTCIDGKQRLSSIRDFMHGRIPCHDRKGTAWYFCPEIDKDGNEVKRRSRKILPYRIRNEFCRKDVLCIEYHNLSEPRERELFSRVQLGVPLTAAEAFRATQGAWQKFAESYVVDFPEVIGLTKTQRASDFKLILTCFVQIYECKHPTASNGVPKLKGSMPALDKFCQSDKTLTTKTQSDLRAVFMLFDRLIKKSPETFTGEGFTRVKTFAPLELVAVCVLLSQKGDRPEGMLVGDIRALREELRHKHVDLRLNEDCWKSAWEYIDNLEAYRGTVDSSTVPSRKAKRTGGRARRSFPSEKEVRRTSQAAEKATSALVPETPSDSGAQSARRSEATPEVTNHAGPSREVARLGPLIARRSSTSSSSSTGSSSSEANSIAARGAPVATSRKRQSLVFYEGDDNTSRIAAKRQRLSSVVKSERL